MIDQTQEGLKVRRKGRELKRLCAANHSVSFVWGLDKHAEDVCASVSPVPASFALRASSFDVIKLAGSLRANLLTQPEQVGNIPQTLASVSYEVARARITAIDGWNTIVSRTSDGIFTLCHRCAGGHGPGGAVRDGTGSTGELEERDQEGVADLTSFRGRVFKCKHNRSHRGVRGVGAVCVTFVTSLRATRLLFKQTDVDVYGKQESRNRGKGGSWEDF